MFKINIIPQQPANVRPSETFTAQACREPLVFWLFLQPPHPTIRGPDNGPEKRPDFERGGCPAGHPPFGPIFDHRLVTGATSEPPRLETTRTELTGAGTAATTDASQSPVALAVTRRKSAAPL